MTRFLQVRHLKEMIVQMFKGKSSEAGVSSFQALSIALSGRVGTGNIAGVATAIAFGGPGAVFWMWAIAFIGAASAFVESTLAQIYKVKQDGQYRGGPAYYIEKGLGIKWFAVLFAAAALIAMALLMPGVQSNSIAAGVKNAFGISPFITGCALVLLLGFIIFGGVKRIANAAQMIVPFMALGYILLSLIIIVMNVSELPAVISLIFKSAFALDSAFGGLIGMAISWVLNVAFTQTKPAKNRAASRSRCRSFSSGQAGAGSGIFCLYRHLVCMFRYSFHDLVYRYVQYLGCRWFLYRPSP